MAQLGEIGIFAFSAIPSGWALCDGTTLNRRQNGPLFSILNYTYGGDKNDYFALPNLAGRTPMCYSNTAAGPDYLFYPLGTLDGSETVALTNCNVPSHSHNFVGSTQPATSPSPDGCIFASAKSETTNSSTTFSVYLPQGATMSATLAQKTVATVGGVGHNNMQPFLVLNFCICVLGGIFPNSDSYDYKSKAD